MPPPYGYATLQDVRDEGLPVSVADDTRVGKLLAAAELLVEQYTGNFFRSVSAELTMNGNNGDTLFLPFPIISVTSLKINNGGVALDASKYRVYNGRAAPNDDRANPKIQLITSDISIFTALRVRTFSEGYDQRVDGSWGYLESDGSVPVGVRDAVVEIVMLNAEKKWPPLIGRGYAGPITREQVDRHSQSFGAVGFARYTARSVLPMHIQQVLDPYRAPVRLGLAGGAYALRYTESVT
jgi:hypothetical protein